jgi:serine/threonine-protein kinase HipA
MQRGNVYRNGELVGTIWRDENGNYGFRYASEYLKRDDALAISVNLPLREEPFRSEKLFPFFFNLLAEGAVKEIQCRGLKIDPDDEFTRLLKTAGSNTVGAVTVEEVPDALL